MLTRLFRAMVALGWLGLAGAVLAAVNGFDISPIASPQFTNQPFAVTITARDETGQPALGFTGPATLAAYAGPLTNTLFYDDFEDGSFSDWTLGTGGSNYVRTITTSTAAGGLSSLTMVGGTTNHFTGLAHAISPSQPSLITFWTRASVTNANGGYFAAANAANVTNCAVFFYFQNNGTMGLFETSGGFHGVPYVAQQWYKITLVLNWATQRMDMYTNGVAALSSIRFRATIPTITGIYLYNYHNTQAWWDEIDVTTTLPPPPAVNPTNADGFVNGVWTGSVAVRGPVTNIMLRVSDTAGHTGLSNPFDVMRTNQPPVIVTPPASQTVLEGDSAFFSTSVYGLPPLSYQWRLNNTNLAGATNATLTISKVSTNQAGPCVVVVTNLFGSVTSAPVALTVYSLWSLGGSLNAPQLTWSTGGNTNWVAQTNVTHDGIIAARSGTIKDSQQSWMETTISTGPGMLFFWWKVSSENSYDYLHFLTNSVEVTSICGEVDWQQKSYRIPGGTQTLRWNYTKDGSVSSGQDRGWVDQVSFIPDSSAAPVITDQPSRLTVAMGGTATFTVGVFGSAPLLYQWRWNGTNIPAATNATFTLSHAQTGDAGNYSVVVSNTFGFAISADAALSVLNLPANGDFQIVALQTNNSTVVEHETLTGYYGGAIAASTAQVFFTGDNYTARFALADLSGGTALTSRYEALVSDLRTGSIYSLASNTTLLTASYNSQQVNRLVELDGTTGTPTGAYIALSTPIVLASYDVGIYSGYGCVVLHNGTSVYLISLPTGQVVNQGAVSMPTYAYGETWAIWGVAETSGGAVNLVYVKDSQTIVRTAVPSGTTTTLASFSNLGDMASLTVSIPNGRWYFHHDYSSQFGGTTETLGYADAQLVVIGSTNPPVISIQPTNQAIEINQPAVLQVIAYGTSPLSYQWRKNGMNIAGATNAAYAIVSTQTNDAAAYSVFITNLYGSVLSTNAMLTVFIVPPAISVQPSGLTVDVGYPALLQVTAYGSTPLSYQWRKDGTNIDGATSSSYSVASAQLTNAGLYSVLVSSPFGFVLSSNATLAVLPTPPSILVQPADHIVPAGRSVTFQVTAGGALPFSYQWCKETVNILRATNAAFTVQGAQASDAGRYCVIVTNNYGAVTSQWATLTVSADAPLSVLLIYDTPDVGTPALQQALQNAGLVVSLSDTDETGYTGDNPAPDEFDAIIHLNGTTFSTAMPLAGQRALTNFVWNGGGFLHTEWDSYEVTAGMSTMRDLILFDFNYNSGVVALTNVPGQQAHPILAHVPPAFSFQASYTYGQVHAFTNQPVTTLMRTTNGYDAVAVRELNLGRIVGFSHAGNYDNSFTPFTLADTNVQQLFIDGVRWAGSRPLSITSQPAGCTLALHGTAVFTVGVGGAPPFFFQWRKGGVAIPGATNASLSFADAQPADAGLYSVNVSNMSRSLISSNAQFTVLVLGDLADDFDPSLDTVQWSLLSGGACATNFGGSVSGANALWFGGDGPRQAVTRTVNVASGGLVNFQLRLAGGASAPWEQVDLPEEGVVLEYSADRGSNWVEQARYDTPAFFAWTALSVTIPPAAQTAATLFRWRQLSHSGAGYDHWALDDVSIVAVCTPPLVLSQPVAFQKAAPGPTLVLQAVVTGGTPLRYQWRKDGVPLADGGRISGAASNILSLANVLESDTGTYSVTVTNPCGGTLSSNASLLVSALDHFAWYPVPSPQLANAPFAVVLAALDAFNQPATNFIGSLTLRAMTGGLSTNTLLGALAPADADAETETDFLTDGYAFTPQTNLLVTHVRHCSGDKVSIWADDGTLLVAQPVTSVEGTWLETPLAAPLELPAGATYRIGVMWTNTYWRLAVPPPFPHGTIGLAYSSDGDAFPELSSATGVPLVDLRYIASSAVPVALAPVSTGPFTQGTWIGHLTVPVAVTNLLLEADDGAGRFCVANLIDVAAQVWVTALLKPRTVEFSWPGALSGMVLEACTNLAVPDWQPVTNAPVVLEQQNIITIPIDQAPAAFYRLRPAAHSPLRTPTGLAPASGPVAPGSL